VSDIERRLEAMGTGRPIEPGPLAQIKARGDHLRRRRRHIEVGVLLMSALLVFGGASAIVVSRPAHQGVLVGAEDGSTSPTTTLSGDPALCGPRGYYPPTSGPTPEGRAASAILENVTGEAPLRVLSGECGIAISTSFGDVMDSYWGGPPPEDFGQGPGITPLMGLPADLTGYLATTPTARGTSTEIRVVRPGTTYSVVVDIGIIPTAGPPPSTSTLVDVAVRLLEEGPFTPG
jgi:hypothetical protein